MHKLINEIREIAKQSKDFDEFYSKMMSEEVKRKYLKAMRPLEYQHVIQMVALDYKLQ